MKEILHGTGWTMAHIINAEESGSYIAIVAKEEM